MTKDLISPTVTFRFLMLNKMQAFTLTKEVEGASYCESDIAGRYLGWVELKEQRLDELNIFFVRQQIPLEDCDIHVLADHCEKNQQVSAPRIVNKLLKHIDCRITFSVGGFKSL